MENNWQPIKSIYGIKSLLTEFYPHELLSPAFINNIKAEGFLTFQSSATPCAGSILPRHILLYSNNNENRLRLFTYSLN